MVLLFIFSLAFLVLGMSSVMIGYLDEKNNAVLFGIWFFLLGLTIALVRAYYIALGS